MAEELPRRKNLRLEGYDYSQQGAYFLTICTAGKLCTLATVRRGDPCGRPLPELTPLGSVVQDAITQVAATYAVEVRASVIMPNHIHLLMVLQAPEERATARVAPTTGRLIGAIKSVAANVWRRHCDAGGLHAGPIWQRGYYDHVIRDEQDYLRIWKYIDENPAKWSEDCYYIER